VNLLKIKDKTIGKEVIDNHGATVGKIKDLDLDLYSNKIDAIELEDTGLSSKLRIGNKKIVPFDLVEQIGDKVIIKKII
jgi:sporulation protein YlmC with PRC-barrel domain